MPKKYTLKIREDEVDMFRELLFRGLIDVPVEKREEANRVFKDIRERLHLVVSGNYPEFVEED